MHFPLISSKPVACVDDALHVARRIDRDGRRVDIVLPDSRSRGPQFLDRGPRGVPHLKRIAADRLECVTRETAPRALRGEVYSECVQMPLPRYCAKSQPVTRKSVVPSSSRMPPVVLLRPAGIARSAVPHRARWSIVTWRDRLTSTANPAMFRNCTRSTVSARDILGQNAVPGA